VAQKSPVWDLEALLVVAGVGVAAWIGYEIYKTATAAAGAVSKGASLVASGVNAAGGAIATPIANTITALTAQPAMNVQGNVLFPDGTGGPLSTYQVYTDSAGEVYVKQGGATYQLQQSDAQGDWPAVLVPNL
jgi:hypothetical protein